MGKGISAVVKRATENTTGLQVALKLTQRDPNRVSEGSLANFNTEIAALSLLTHPHIIKLVSHDRDWTYKNEHGIDYNYLCLVLELCVHGALFEIVKDKGRFSEVLARTYFRKLMETVKYCHDMGVVHRDLKPENLLLDEHFDLKIADFGCSKVRNLPSAHVFGTDGYQPPEVRTDGVSEDPKIDVYDCGLILFFMIFREVTLCKASQYRRYLNNKAQFWSQRSIGAVSSALLDLLNAMLEPDPHQRISVAAILSHPWTLGTILSSEDMQTEMAARYLIAN